VIKKLLPSIICFGGFIAFLLLSNPQHLPAVLLIVPFILLFCGLFSLSRLLLGYLREPSKSTGSSVAIPLVIATIPTLLIILGTVSQLTPRDSLLAIVFGLGLVVYLRRARFWQRLS
jgi:prolipoprotein diacylglyceryltransferase